MCRLVDDVIRTAGRLDVLVNLVGGFAMGPVVETDLSLWATDADHERDLGVLAVESRSAPYDGTRNRSHSCTWRRGRQSSRSPVPPPISSEIEIARAHPRIGARTERFWSNGQWSSSHHYRYACQSCEYAKRRSSSWARPGIHRRNAAVSCLGCRGPDQWRCHSDWHTRPDEVGNEPRQNEMSDDRQEETM